MACLLIGHMTTISAILRTVAVPLLIFGLLTPAISAHEQQQKSFGFPPRQQVIGFLTRSIDWYHSASVDPSMPLKPADIPFRENAQTLRLQSLQLSFDYAKAIAAAEAGSVTSTEQHSDSSARDSSGSDPQRWMKIQALCETDIQNARNDVMSIRDKADRERGKDRARLNAALAESESRLNLVQAKCHTYGNLLDFVRTMHASEQNESLDFVIDDLSRTVPELANASGATLPSQSGVSTAVPPETGSSIPYLISDVMLYRRKLRTLDQAGRATDALAQASQNLRTPLVQYLNSALQGANLSGSDPQPNDLDALRQQQARLDNLSAQITALSPATVALAKQQLLFGTFKSDLANWRTLVVSQYGAAWKTLIIHLLAVVIAIGLLVAVIATLRRVTFRYVRDASHRRTALIAEWTLLWLGIFLILVFTFASNLGSLATFLGLVTAGLAVALQNVILAVLGYTVLVGKLGLRLGDKVQISGVTGEVLEFGLLQFQVREIDGQGLPTGRIGSFSNSFVFVSPAIGIFKLGIAKSNTDSSDLPLVVGPHGISIDPKTSNA